MIEFIKNIKSIHSSLVFASLIILIAIFTNTSNSLDKAILDTKNIIESKNKLLANQIWLEKYVDEKYRIDDLPFLNEILFATSVKIDEKEKPFIFYTKSNYNNTLNGPRSFSSSTIGKFSKRETEFRIALNLKRYPNERVHLKNPISLNEFKELWDDLNNRFLYSPQEISKVILLKKYDLSIEEEVEPQSQILEIVTDSTGIEEIIKEEPVPIKNLNWGIMAKEDWEKINSSNMIKGKYDMFYEPDMIASHYLFSNYQPTDKTRYKFIIPILCKQIKIEPQEYIANRVKTDWDSGKFKNTFEDLNELTEGIQSLELTEILTFLEREKQKHGGKIELLGMKIPIYIIPIIGITLILSLLIYLNIHLTKLRSIIDNNNYPWIGLYEDIKSKVVTFSTIIIIPATVVILLLTKLNFQSWTSFVIVIMTISCLLFFTYSNYKELNKIWKIL